MDKTEATWVSGDEKHFGQDVNRFFWAVTMISLIGWVCFRVGESYFENIQFQGWYNLLVPLAVVCILMLHVRSDPALRAISLKYSDVFKKHADDKVTAAQKDMSFSQKHNNLNQIPVIRQLSRWIYTNGIIFTIVLSLIFINAWLIRVDNLNVLPLQNDEFLSDSAVKYILGGQFKFSDLQYGADANQSEEFYSRAMPYSLGAALTVKILGGDYMSYFNIRFFSVICGFLTLVVFYFLLRKHFSRSTLVFSLLALSTFHLFVYYSRVARMYALHVLLFFIMVLIFDSLFSKIVHDKLMRYIGIRETIKYYTSFIKQNALLFALFVIIFVIDINVHYTGIFILPIIYCYALIHVPNHRQLFYPVSLVIGAIVVFLGLFLSGVHFVGDWYLNFKGEVYWRWFDQNFQYLKGGYFTVLVFLFPLFFIRQAPAFIKLSYVAFFSVLPLYIFLFNGNKFSDPRYLMYLYPFFIVTVVYSLSLIASMIFHTTRYQRFVFVSSLLIMFALIVTPFRVNGLCLDNALMSCPISDNSRIFSVDRWNYNHDEYYQIIKSSIDSDTVIASRSIYDFYIEKYGLTNPLMRLSEPSKKYVYKWSKFSISQLANKDVVLIDYPQIAYYKNYNLPYDHIYNYLMNKRKNKTELYRSADNKVVVYRFDKKAQ